MPLFWTVCKQSRGLKRLENVSKLSSSVFPRIIYITVVYVIVFIYLPGCIRRPDAEITLVIKFNCFSITYFPKHKINLISQDYDAIDRSDPPLFVNNTRDRVVVASGRSARMECRVANLGDRAVSPSQIYMILCKDFPPRFVC